MGGAGWGGGRSARASELFSSILPHEKSVLPLQVSPQVKSASASTGESAVFFPPLLLNVILLLEPDSGWIFSRFDPDFVLDFFAGTSPLNDAETGAGGRLALSPAPTRSIVIRTELQQRRSEAEF